jgi:hypothetical protein
MADPGGHPLQRGAFRVRELDADTGEPVAETSSLPTLPVVAGSR